MTMTDAEHKANYQKQVDDRHAKGDLSIPPFLDRRPIVWTPTMLLAYRDNCPHQLDQRSIAKKIPFVSTPEMDWGNQCHDALEHRVLPGRKQLPESMRHFEPMVAQFDGYPVRAEARLAVNRNWEPVDYFAKDVWGRGRADLVIINETTAYIGDWKSGNVRENPGEIKMHAALLAMKYPQIETFKGQYLWLKEMRAGELYDLSDIDGTCDEIEELYAKIMHDREFDAFEKRPSGLCGWCPVEDCEHYYISPKRMK